ncbi:MAG: hypothetical protein GY856_08075, partial [bacterium]|nr:hypothetical protein [bacterium]
MYSNQQTRTLPAAMACFLALAVSAGSATNAQKPPLDETAQQLNLESFDYVWTTIRDKHFDPELGGLDWPAIRDELRPQTAAAATMSEARAVLRDMISRLGQSHFSIIPEEAYEMLEKPAVEGWAGGVTGIDARVVGTRALVTALTPDSPAAAAGIRPGWEILRIGDEDLVPKLEVLNRELDGKTLKDFVLARAVLSRLRGPIGESVAVAFLDGDDRTVELELDRVEPRGRKVQFGHLPPAYVWVDVARIDDGHVGYVAFNAFLDPNQVMQAFNEAMESFMDADGIVIDVRGNGGGMGFMAIGMTGWLIAEKSLHLGTVFIRDHQLKMLVIPRPRTYGGPVAVLVDGSSASASEFFAAGLQDTGRACIVGSPTSGAVLGSMIEKLPNGDGFQYVASNYVSEKT